QWMRKTGFAGTVSQCNAPVPVNREALVVTRGGHEDIVRGGFVVPSEGAGLPPILHQPLPAGFLKTAAGVSSAAAAAPPAAPPSSAAGDPFDRYNAPMS